MDFTLAFVLACVFVGLSKGGLIGPIGGTLALPLLVQATYNGAAITVQGATGVLLALLMIGDVFAIPAFWRAWDWRYLRYTLPAAVVGVALGTWVLVSLDSTTLKHILGVVTLLLIVYKVANTAMVRYLQQAAYAHRPWHGILTGVTSGIGSALANTGGPPMTAYMLLQKMSPRTFVGTQTLFFVIVNWIKVPGYVAGGVFNDLGMIGLAPLALLLIPLLVFGSRPIIHRVNHTVFDWLITGLLLWAAVSLLTV